MFKQYNENEIIEKIEYAIRDHQLATLYKEPYIKRTGKTRDTKKLYSEIASSKLLDSNIKTLFFDKAQIKKIHRDSYKVNHTGNINKNSNRDEEILAIKLKDRMFDYLGTILEYQIPLKSRRVDKGVGKIDLLSVDSSKNKAFIIELKAKNNREGLFKAILEITTYSYQLNEHQLLEDFGIPNNAIIKSVLLEKGSQGYKEARELESRPNLRRLTKAFDIEIFLLESRKNSIIEHIKI
mgnify:CR=1 FL=1